MRVMVIGGDSLVGSALTKTLTKRGDAVIVTSRRKKQHGTHFFLDLASKVPQEFPESDVAVICAAITRISDCRQNPTMSRQVNVNGPVEIARRLSERGTKVIFLSTNAVFDASVPCVMADRPPNPRTVYGAQKAEAEKAILALGSQATVCRLTKILYPGFPLISQWARALANGESIRAFANHAMSPINLHDVIATIVSIARKGEGGLFQISGASDISYLDAAKYVAMHVGAREECVITARAEELIQGEEIMSYGSLDTSRATALIGYTPPDPHAVIDFALSGMAPASISYI